MTVSGELEAHWNTLWSGGFVQFFTVRSGGGQLRKAGFENIAASRADRTAPVAKAMVLSCTKPC